MNKIVPIDQTKIRVSYNYEKCYKCNTKKALINTEYDSIAYCVNCKIKVLLYSYIDIENYENIIKNKTENYTNIIKNKNETLICKDTLEKFLNSANI